MQGRLHKCCDCHRLLHSGGQEPFCSWTRTHPRHGQQLVPCITADFPQHLHRFGQTKPFFIFNFSSFSYLGLLLSPTPSAVHAYLNRKTIVLRDPVSFHPVTLCRANHSLNVLTVKLLLSLLFSTKFSHNNPPVIFFTNKIYE